MKSASLTALVACGHDRAPAPAVAADDRRSTCDAPADAGRIDTLFVSENAHGMATTVRWMRSPDGCALLVVEDPVGAEAEPIPDALIYAVSTARGVRSVRLDSVWDVSPDVRWTRLVVGRAHVARAGGDDRITDETWRALASSVARPLADVRAAAFPAGAMSAASSVAQPAVLDLAAVARGEPAAWRTVPVLGGWRVRWAPDGSTLLVGSGPRRAGDDEPSAAWLRVSAAGRPLGAPIAAPALPIAAGWREAPLLDVSTTPVPSAAPLDSTRDGRVLLAIAPRVASRAGEPTWRVVLYVR